MTRTGVGGSRLKRSPNAAGSPSFDPGWIEERREPDDILGQPAIAGGSRRSASANGRALPHRVSSRTHCSRAGDRFCQIDSAGSGMKECFVVLLMRRSRRVPCARPAAARRGSEYVQTYIAVRFTLLSCSARRWRNRARMTWGSSTYTSISRSRRYQPTGRYSRRRRPATDRDAAGSLERFEFRRAALARVSFTPAFRSVSMPSPCRCLQY